MIDNKYKEYLNSEKWLGKKEIILDFYNNECCICGSSKFLNIHLFL